MTENIQVYVRCRPLKPEETPSSLEMVEDTHEVRVPSSTRIFNFNRVFPPDASQEQVYNQVVRPLVTQVLGGLNCTVFAYGQTGTGKTYTMEGDRLAGRVSWHGTGLIPRAAGEIFKTLRNRNTQFNVYLSFLEVYSEDVHDLLSPPEDTAKLRIFDDANRKGSVIIEGLREIRVDNEFELFGILKQGASKRQTAATLLNACSSRSHSVFTITVESGTTYGRLNLVDLAGSENISRSGAQDKHAREAGNINQSLLTLTRVIEALADKKRPHVPYRESKLTRILQDSLGGSTRTCMIATVSPAQADIATTISALDYASRARSIMNKPEVNAFPIFKKSNEDYHRHLQALEERYQAGITKLEFKIRNEVALDFKKEIELIKESMREHSQEELNLIKQQRDTLKLQLEEKENECEHMSKQLNDLKQEVRRSERIASDKSSPQFAVPVLAVQRTAEPESTVDLQWNPFAIENSNVVRFVRAVLNSRTRRAIASIPPTAAIPATADTPVLDKEGQPQDGGGDQVPPARIPTKPPRPAASTSRNLRTKRPLDDPQDSEIKKTKQVGEEQVHDDSHTEPEETTCQDCFELKQAIDRGIDTSLVWYGTIRGKKRGDNNFSPYCSGAQVPVPGFIDFPKGSNYKVHERRRTCNPYTKHLIIRRVEDFSATAYGIWFKVFVNDLAIPVLLEHYDILRCKNSLVELNIYFDDLSAHPPVDAQKRKQFGFKSMVIMRQFVDEYVKCQDHLGLGYHGPKFNEPKGYKFAVQDRPRSIGEGLRPMVEPDSEDRIIGKKSVKSKKKRTGDKQGKNAKKSSKKSEKKHHRKRKQSTSSSSSLSSSSSDTD